MANLLTIPSSDQLKIAAYAAIGAGVTYYVGTKLQGYMLKRKVRNAYKSLRETKHRTLEDLKLELAKNNNAINQEILNMDLETLIEKLQKRELKASEVLEVYQRKALEVHEKTNCLTGAVSEASEMAVKLDGKDKPVGLLHGVPISVKDNVHMGGYTGSVGLGKLCNMPSPQDCPLIKVLKSQGAIPYVQTGIPQMLMSYESSNPIFGRVSNPLDPTRGSGGSSGGEGAVVGGGGSILGVGSDIGGSIRAPSAFTGIYGLKPGVHRISYGSPIKGQTLIPATLGPMAKDVHSLAVFMKAVLVPDMFKMDFKCPPVPFRDDIYKSDRKLTIGYYTDDGYCPAVPACARAVLVAKEALEKAGHKVVPWNPPNVTFAMKAIAKSLNGDGGGTVARSLKGEDIDPCITGFTQLALASKLKRGLWALVNKYLKNYPNLALYIESFAGCHTTTEWWDWIVEVQNYRESFFEDWHNHGLDAVICPSFTFPPLKHGSSWQYLRYGNYCMLYNVLDTPAGVLPVTKVSKADIEGLKDWSTGDDVTDYVRKDQQDSEGLPVAVQVATAKWEEEMCLNVMRQIEKNVNYK